MKIGIFFSRDNGIISKTIDVDSLSKKYSHLSASKVYDSFFTKESQEDMIETVKKNKLEGIVFAGNTKNYFDSVLNASKILEILEDIGVNDNKIEFANIKEQAALPHNGDNKFATEKAKLLIDVALKKIQVCHNINSVYIPPRRTVMIVGTTIGSIIAAKELLDKDYRVFLIEKNKELRIKEGDLKEILPTLSTVQSNINADIIFNATIVDFYGWCGDFRVIVKANNEEKEVFVGGVILSLSGDTEWIEELRPKMQLDIDKEGQIKGKFERKSIGLTSFDGISFIPYKPEGNSFEDEMNGASQAVLFITTMLDKNELKHPIWVSEIDENVCGGCGTCVKTCAFSASTIDPYKKISVIDIKKCKGCGNCVVSCPTGARDLIRYPKDYIFEGIDLLCRGVDGNSDPKILAILCRNCGYKAADTAGKLALESPELKYSPNVLPIKVECGGNIDTQYILYAFKKGFDGVLISICRDGFCHHIFGNTDMERRIGLYREVLHSRNIDDHRLRIIKAHPHEGDLFSKEVNHFHDDLKKMSFTKIGEENEQ